MSFLLASLISLALAEPQISADSLAHIQAGEAKAREELEEFQRDLDHIADPALDISERLKSRFAFESMPLSATAKNLLKKHGFPNVDFPQENAFLESQRRGEAFDRKVASLNKTYGLEGTKQKSIVGHKGFQEINEASKSTKNIAAFINKDSLKVQDLLKTNYDFSKPLPLPKVEDEESQEGELVLEPSSFLDNSGNASAFLQENTAMNPLLAALYATTILNDKNVQMPYIDDFLQSQKEIPRLQPNHIASLQNPMAVLVKNLKVFKALKGLRDILQRVYDRNQRMEVSEHQGKASELHSRPKDLPPEEIEASSGHKSKKHVHYHEGQKKTATNKRLHQKQIPKSKKDTKHVKARKTVNEIMKEAQALESEEGIKKAELDLAKQHEKNLDFEDPFSQSLKLEAIPHLSRTPPDFREPLAVDHKKKAKKKFSERKMKPKQVSPRDVEDEESLSIAIEPDSDPQTKSSHSFDEAPWAEEVLSGSEIEKDDLDMALSYKEKSLAARKALKAQLNGIVSGKI